MDLATSERIRLCDLFAALGPDAPTCCGDWTTYDLAAHLVVRDSQPLALPGLVVPLAHPVTAWFEGRARTTDFDELVGRVRKGPPRWNPMGFPGLRQPANLHEYFVHHEDVRRANGAGAREDTPELDEPLWTRLKASASFFTRRVKGVTLRLQRPDGASITARTAEGPMVTVSGTPRELTVWAWNRKEVADVELSGEAAAVAAVDAAKLGP
jgi:uncharacterized protein (TIGR03085 family)